MAEGDGGDSDPAPPGPGQDALENLLLAVASWWVGRHSRIEVLDLMTRHFLPVDMYVANQELAQACQLLPPGSHRNSINRSAGESYAIDLYNNLYQLSNDKKLPRILLSSDDLGKVPLGALSVSDERSVSARLETLETSIGKITSAVEKMSATLASPRAPSVLQPNAVSVPVPQQVQEIPQVVVSPAPVQPGSSDWAHVVAGDPLSAGGGGGTMAGALQGARDREQQGQGQNGRVRNRSNSPSIKRKASGEDGDGFKPQGRPRKTAGGSSKVMLEDLGEYQPSQQFYISNTPGHSSGDLIKKVLEKCSAPLLGGAAILTVLEVECLTKEDDPRTKCWKVVVPFKFRSVMENDELYPEGWRHRKFFGGRKLTDQKKKQPRLEDPRLKEAEQELERERVAIQQRQEDERLAAENQHADMQPDGPPTAASSGEHVGSSSETSDSMDSQ